MVISQIPIFAWVMNAKAFLESRLIASKELQCTLYI